MSDVAAQSDIIKSFVATQQADRLLRRKETTAAILEALRILGIKEDLAKAIIAMTQSRLIDNRGATIQNVNNLGQFIPRTAQGGRSLALFVEQK